MKQNNRIRSDFYASMGDFANSIFLIGGPVLYIDRVHTELEFVFQDNRWTVSLQKFGFDGIDPTTLNRKRFFQWVHDNLEKTINRSPRSASFQKGQVVPHQQGQNGRSQDDRRLVGSHSLLFPKTRSSTSNLSRAENDNFSTKRLKEKHLSSYTTQV